MNRDEPALPRKLIDVACRIRVGESLFRDDELVDAAAHELVSARAEIERLTAELERERMRLAACGVVALANTRVSAVEARIKMHEDYRSASCDDVAGAVDREMGWRERAEAAEADARRYRWLRAQTQLELRSDGAKWTRPDGSTFIASHCLCSGGTQFAAAATLDDTVDAAIGAAKEKP